ncbi:hypothetical protein EK21DRAFT_117749 [Setomelanomma holmii]|uniref:Uncharacterized protein n=1 Tax=Setomelanomma holmii TaxID=210430 RepID=A0A9P4GYP9_9PLEO|nr:hypothetical protein EK21DRAFT_117749 [Setomelanomma holmii]
MPRNRTAKSTQIPISTTQQEFSDLIVWLLIDDESSNGNRVDGPFIDADRDHLPSRLKAVWANNALPSEPFEPQVLFSRKLESNKKVEDAIRAAGSKELPLYSVRELDVYGTELAKETLPNCGSNIAEISMRFDPSSEGGSQIYRLDTFVD